MNNFFKVCQIPSKQDHWERNKYQKGQEFATVELAIQNGYIQHGAVPGATEEEIEAQDNFHEMGEDHDGTMYGNGNNKYTKLAENGISSYELVFDKEGKLVTDPVNIGTYNFYHHSTSSFISLIGHFFQDVLPYWLWGNNEVDYKETTVYHRIFASYRG